MATKKKASKKTSNRGVAHSKATPRTKTVRKKQVKGRTTPKKKLAKSKAPSKKPPVKVTSRGAKVSSKKSTGARKKAPRQRKQNPRTGKFASAGLGARSGGQSGDLQGLSDAERASAESVDELLEEGNALEAGVVAGVEEADGQDEREVRTHEVPEDDVPGEYLDEE